MLWILTLFFLFLAYLAHPIFGLIVTGWLIFIMWFDQNKKADHARKMATFEDDYKALPSVAQEAYNNFKQECYDVYKLGKEVKRNVNREQIEQYGFMRLAQKDLTFLAKDAKIDLNRFNNRVLQEYRCDKLAQITSQAEKQFREDLLRLSPKDVGRLLIKFRREQFREYEQWLENKEELRKELLREKTPKGRRYLLSCPGYQVDYQKWTKWLDDNGLEYKDERM